MTGSDAGAAKNRGGAAPVVDITYYTDPLCSWSWALEPIWRRIRYEWGERLTWRYRMGGMIATWDTYADPITDVSVPGHMGPQWLEVSRFTGMPMEPRIWNDDPPRSSYPACMAVKAAELQGAAAGDRFLREVREAVMTKGRNVARREVLLELAEEIAADRDGDGEQDMVFDDGEFRRSMVDGRALEALQEDLREVKYRDIGRFPTLVIRGAGGAVALVGYRPYDLLAPTLLRVAGHDVEPPRATTSPSIYAEYWRHVAPRLTQREIAELRGPAAQRA